MTKPKCLLERLINCPIHIQAEKSRRLLGMPGFSPVGRGKGEEEMRLSYPVPNASAGIAELEPGACVAGTMVSIRCSP